MATMERTEERRDFSRIPLERRAQIEIDGARIPCALVDISLRGALVRVPHSLSVQVGRAAVLDVMLDDLAPWLRMRGVVAHRAGNALGLRCREVDQEGMAHLRRLLEMNLGDERMLRRELGALVARPGA